MPADSPRKEKTSAFIGVLIGPAVWLLIFGGGLAWRAQNLAAFGPVNDEGAHLMWARLAVEGYPLYRETYAVQAPLFLETVGLAFRLAGPTVQAGRWAILITGYGGLAAALSWLAFRREGWPGAVAAMLLMAVSPLIFSLSRLVMAEIPATALAVLSIGWLLLFWEREPGRGWLALSGLAMGLSLITKALYPFLVAPVGLVLLIPKNPKKGGTIRLKRPGRVAVDSLIWGIGALIPPAAILLIYGPEAIYDQLIAFRGDLRAAIPLSGVENWAQFVAFFKTHWGFWLLAFGGIIEATVRRNRAGTVIWAVWLGGGLLMLAWHTPLFPHHFVALLPPLILLGADFIARRWRTKGKPYTLTLLVIIAALNLPGMAQANQRTAAIVTGGREQQALALLGDVSNPTDFLMGDSQLLIFMADRRTPPQLGDVALVAIKAGRQTSERMIRLNQRYQAPAVVQWSLRLPWLPEYLAWVEGHYMARRVWDNDHIIYFAPRFPPERAIPNRRYARLGDSLALRGHRIDRLNRRQLALKLFWQATAAPPEDYTIFTQLLDDRGRLAAGWDSQPLGGHFPTGQWPPGEIITDMVRLPLPADLPPGDYTLITGMYRLDTGERLLVSEGGDYITLTTIKIE